MTHYQTLGVEETATQDEIKQAYRRLAMQHHPDRGGDATEFQKIQEAYGIIGDDQQRQQYDQERKFGHQTFRFNFNGQEFDGMPPDMADLFGQFGFAHNPFGGHPFTRRQRNRDLRVGVVLDLASTLEAQKKVLSVQTTTGERFTVEVEIPRGITSNSQIKYAGLGDNQFSNLPRGDLYVIITVQNDPRFLQHGIDLITLRNIDCFDAILGCEVEVETLDQKKILISIPKGTQPGSKFKIAGQGLWHQQMPARGNLIVEISVKIPRELTENQLSMLRNIKNEQ